MMLDLAIPDSGPLITFGLLDRLDLLDRFKCPILVTDMVSEELLRGPDTAKDKVVFEKWFALRGNRVQTVDTTYGAMWKELGPEARERVKRLHPNAGELSIREFTDTLRDTIPEADQVLVLFEENAVKKLKFGPHVTLIHTFAFMLALENLGVISSADALHAEVLRRGRNLAKDIFERRASAKEGGAPDWQIDYDVNGSGDAAAP
jgi:hypothetical protein